MILAIAEKPSVAQSIANVLGASSRNGSVKGIFLERCNHLEGNIPESSGEIAVGYCNRPWRCLLRSYRAVWGSFSEFIIYFSSLLPHHCNTYTNSVSAAKTFVDIYTSL